MRYLSKKVGPTRTVIVCLLPYVAIFLGFTVLRNAWFATLFYHLIVAAAVIRGPGRKAAARVAAGLQAAPAIVVCALCALSYPAILLLWPWMAIPDLDVGVELNAYGIGKTWWVFVVYISTVHPLFEEIWWRGLGPPQWYGDLAFAGFHAFLVAPFLQPAWIVVVLVVLAVAARIWREMVSRTGGLAIPILSHAVADLCIVLAVHRIALG
jgi:membrane protease YdiL (CAAX protease family)